LHTRVPSFFPLLVGTESAQTEFALVIIELIKLAIEEGYDMTDENSNVKQRE
jgi:hypothetical protein